MMDFDFSEGQYELQREARRFLEQQCPPALVRDLLEDPAGWSRDLWKQMADLGWMALPFPEQYGGLGEGFLDLALLVGELGRALAPVPYLSSVVLAGHAILACGSEEQRARWLPAIASGERIGVLALTERGGSFDPERVSLTARRDGDIWRLDGEKAYVLDAPAADFAVVAARADGVARLFLVEDGFETSASQAYDPSRPVGTVRLDATAGEPLPGDPALAWRLAVAATCAEMVGVAQKLLDMSVDYAKVREQFGRPIGSFQAIKHKLAEMFTELEAARAAAFYACWAVASGADDASVAVSIAKSYCGDACGHLAGEAIQTHGGIAYTWEHDTHLYVRRIKSLEAFLGDADEHRERIAELIGL